MQAVLSAASHRATKLLQKAVNGAASQKETKQNEASGTAYIPVPDAAGVVDNYEELYPAGRWKQPNGYVKFSNTIDECMPAALVDGFTYVMDERDAEWLDKMNQEARGEGTSSQTAANGGTSTRGNLHRSAKAKGKEAEASTPIAMSEDDFELVMGLFEKVTHDNTPFLHVVRIPLVSFQFFFFTVHHRASNNIKAHAFQLFPNTMMFSPMNCRLHILQVSCVHQTYLHPKL